MCMPPKQKGNVIKSIEAHDGQIVTFRTPIKLMA